MKKLALAIAAAVLLLVPVTASAAEPIKSGKYEITMEMDMPGMPMKMPPQKFTHCVTPEDAEKAQKGQPPQAKPRNKGEDDCKFYDFKLDGNVTTYKMKCEKQNLTGEGKTTYKTDGYEMVNHLKMGDQEIHQKMTGKFLGACDAKK